MLRSSLIRLWRKIVLPILCRCRLRDSPHHDCGFQAVEHESVLQQSRFFVEAVLSAGPRHRLTDYDGHSGYHELGEDCAGVAGRGDITAFWLCDGTSDMAMITDSRRDPILNQQLFFGSRTLAKELGHAFAEAVATGLNACEALDKLDLKVMVFDKVSKAWRRRLITYFNVLNNNEELNEYISLLPTRADGKVALKWSTTFIGGVFYTDTKGLMIINCGDGGGVIMSDCPHVIAPNENRVFFEATFEQDKWMDLDVNVITNITDDLMVSVDKVDGFIVMSDGMAHGDLERILYNINNSTLEREFRKVCRDVLGYAVSSKDDKTVVYGYFLDANDSENS